MERFNSYSRTTRLAVCSAMAIALLAGCTGHGAVASAGKPATVGEYGEQADKGIARLEGQVARSPRSASARVSLAQAYLAAGRFQSAATTFEDAVSLGNNDARTGFGQALAYIGAGRNADALTVLDRWHAEIPASDLGLALALAGHPAEGVNILSDAVRGGEGTAKARQNLAYAYALDGRWAEARVVASQDVPIDQLDARMSEWASRAGPEQFQMRIAGLIGSPVRADAGQPAALALNSVEKPVRMAGVEAPVQPVAAELAPVDAAPAAASTPSLAENGPRAAFEERFVSQPVTPPVVEPVAPMRNARAETVARASAAPTKNGTHLVQLGSFASLDGAKRAWGIFAARNPALRGHAMRITEAQVNGRRFFRVAAAGFQRGSARTMCVTVRQRGGACFAYADARGLPGAAPGKAAVGPMLAQR